MNVKDPVCGITIEDQDASATSTYRGNKILLLLDFVQREVREGPVSLRPHEQSKRQRACSSAPEKLVFTEINTIPKMLFLVQEML